MTWCGIEEHDEIADRFRRCVQHDRLASSFLFIGPSGVGKRLFSLRIAQAFLCDRSPVSDWMPCLECEPCQQVAAGSHPDVDYVKRQKDKTVLTLDLFIGDREHRMQEGLCHRISLRPSSGRRRVAIIDDADYFNEASANCLLKTLEEPPAGAILILLGTSEQRQLPTIRSRCQVIRFRPIPDATLKRILVEQQLLEPELLENESLLNQVVVLAEGSLDKARQLADLGLMSFMAQLGRDWPADPRSGVVNSVELAGQVRKFVDKAGSDSQPRRARFRQIVELRMRSLRRQWQKIVDDDCGAGDASQPSNERDVTELVSDRLDRCIVALQQLDANANLATLIECWVDDLSH